MSKKEREKRKKHKKSGAMAKWREKAGGSNFSDLFSPPEGMKYIEVDSSGTYFLDIVPYVSESGNEFVEAGEYWWEKTFYAHRNIGVNDEWVVCLARTFKKPCPVCEFRAKLADDPEVDEKEIDAYKPTKRIVCNAVNLKKDRDTVKLLYMAHFSIAPEIKRALEAAFEDHEDNMEEFFLPENHNYLKCVVEPNEGGYSGFKVTRVDFKRAKSDLDEDILEQAANLDEILVVKDYDEIKEMLFAGKSEEDDLDDEKPKKKKRKKEPEEEDDSDLTDDDFDDDEDEEPEEKPKRSKKSRKKRKQEEDDDDDDEDEKPVTKKRTKKSRKKRKEEPEEDDDDDDNWEEDDDEDDDNWDD